MERINSSSLKYSFLMTRSVAINSHRRRKACNMGRVCFHLDCYSGSSSAKTLRPYSQIVYFQQKPFFHFSQRGIRITIIHASQKGSFGHLRHFFECPPYSHSNKNWRAWIWSRFRNRLNDEILDTLHSVRGFKHFDPAHVFTPKPFRSNYNLHPVPRHYFKMNHCRRVVPGIISKKRVPYYRLPQIALLVSFPYSFVDSLLKISSSQKYFLAKFYKKCRHSSVLANWHSVFLCQIGILDYVFKNVSAYFRLLGVFRFRKLFINIFRKIVI